MPSPRRDIALRFLLVMAFGLVLGGVISEGSYLLLREDVLRGPQEIELIIPPGTGAAVAAGTPVPSLPADMIFVQGDRLVVRNEDSVAHQLGPIWVPPGANGSLALDQPEEFVLACSFRPDGYLGLDVRRPVTLSIRLQAILAIGLPTGALLAVYSFVVFPLNRAGVKSNGKAA